MRRRLLVAVGVVLAAVAAALIAIVSTRGDAQPSSRAHQLADRPRDPLSSAALAARFAVLRNRHSNRCGMPASALDAMGTGARLQGACCFPMDLKSYVNQVRELNRRYKMVDVIPKDPYDISVRLAKRLIAYERIQLTLAQQRTYARAKPLSSTKGPCCCPCWRWTAFGGQAKYLISRRHYTAREIADIWSAEEGCGGPSHRHA